MNTINTKSNSKEKEKKIHKKNRKRMLRGEILSKTQTKWIWLFHFTFSFLLLLYGTFVLNHDGRKLIPIDKHKVSSICTNNKNENESRWKGYVNVFAENEQDGIICCRNDNDNDNTHNNKSFFFHSFLCNQNIYKWIASLPFASTLTYISTAWLLPLIPVFTRLICLLISIVSISSSSSTSSSNRKSDIQINNNTFDGTNTESKRLLSRSTSTAEKEEKELTRLQNLQDVKCTCKRFLFYFLILNFRGWILFILLNMLENKCLHDNAYIDEEECFYTNIMPSKYSNISKCYGQAFDFSDHIVLFYGHILSIVVFEVLYGWMYPITTTIHQQNISSFINKFMSTVFGIYVYFIVSVQTLKTSMYFHTPLEIFVGYFISLFTIQLFLYHVMFWTGEDNTNNNVNVAFGVIRRIRVLIGFQ